MSQLAKSESGGFVNEYQIQQSNDSRIDLYQIGKWGAIGIITYYLLAEHQAHVFQALPYLFLLACPLMHYFMHGSHSHDSSNQDQHTTHDLHDEKNKGRK
jgi:hypothetical protein